MNCSRCGTLLPTTTVAAGFRTCIDCDDREPDNVRPIRPMRAADAPGDQPAGDEDEDEVRPGLDPGAILDDVAALLAEYVAFPSEAALHAVALWAVHTHVVTAFESTPRLVLLSPEKGTGKTRTLEVLDQIVPSPMHAVNCTSAALFRAVAANRPTLLFDEADTYFGAHTRKEHEELRGLVNAGHRKGAMAYRVVGEASKLEVREFPAFAAVALAGIGDLPDTILDRAVVIRMRRRAPDEHVSPFRLRKVKALAQDIRKRLGTWARLHRDRLVVAEPTMPAGITDRPADVWEALLAVADVVGDDWPARARAAAVSLETVRSEATPSRGVQLLADVHRVFQAADTDRFSSQVLCELLAKLEEAPWGDLRGRPIDPRGLADRLRPYDVRPHTVRIGDETPRGYTDSDFADAWKRYLPRTPGSATSATGATGATETGPLTSGVAGVAGVADVPEGEGVVADAGPQQPALIESILAGHLAGRTPEQIADSMNGNGFAHPRGGGWTAMDVRKALGLIEGGQE